LLRLFLIITGAFFIMTSTSQAQESFFQLEAKSIDGENVQFSSYRDKVILVVNVASRCGYTPQYEGLQSLYSSLKDRGFVVFGFPSNDFGGQEPGSELEIKSFCSSKYGASFPLFSKVTVLGQAKDPVYRFLVGQSGGAEVRWNFEKFLINRQGKVVGRFPSSVSPESPELKAAIEAAL
jgi:glutathione peroxidase